MPALNIDFGKMWCAEHYEPFRQATSATRVIAIGMMLDKLMADPRFFDLCGGSMDKIEGNLYIVAPVCCYLNEKALAEIYLRTGRIGKYGPTS